MTMQLVTPDGFHLCVVSGDNLLKDLGDAKKGCCVDIWGRDHRVKWVRRNTWQIVPIGEGNGKNDQGRQSGPS